MRRSADHSARQRIRLSNKGLVILVPEFSEELPYAWTVWAQGPPHPAGAPAP